MRTAAIEIVAPYPVLLVALLVGIGIVASRRRIIAEFEKAAARVSPDGFTRRLMRFAAHRGIAIGWIWIALAVVGAALKVTGMG